MKLYIIILILLLVYLILINCNKETFENNISVNNRYIEIESAIDMAHETFKNIINTEYNKEVKINLLKNEINEGYNKSNIGKTSQFCAFPEGMYPYFFLFLFYTEYKKNNNNNNNNNIDEYINLIKKNNNNNNNNIDKYINNLIKKNNNIHRIVLNRLNNTKLNYNRGQKYTDNYRFLPDHTGNKKVKEDIKTQKELLINILHKTFQNNNVNPKAVVIFNKDNVSVEKEAEKEAEDDIVYKYLITQKISLTSVSSKFPLTWEDSKKSYCSNIQQNPEDIYTYELTIEFIKTKDNVYCKSLDITNLCMLSLRPCFTEKMEQGQPSQIEIKEPDNTLKDFSKQFRDRLEVHNISGKAGNCFDKDNNILLDRKRIIDCPEEFTWSLPCTQDRDCPYYKKNVNYTNEYGKCNNNYCEIPLGVKSMGYNTKPDMTRKKHINDALCYNCETPNPRCCHKQIDPDYAFKNDYPERLKKRNELAARGLKVKNDTIDLESILKYTTFV